MSILVLPPQCKPLKAPHRIPILETEGELDFELGVVSSAKKDGNRGLCVAGQLYKSSMEPPTNPLLWDLLDPLIRRSAEAELVFDYELYDPEQTHHAVTSGALHSEEGELSDSLCCFVFDCMTTDDFVHQCVHEPYGMRILRYYDEIHKLKCNRIRPLSQRACLNVDDVRKFFQEDLEAGDEGSILRSLEIDGDPEDTRKLRGGWYKHGRSTDNQQIIKKLKNYVTVDGIIVDVEQREEMLPNAPRHHNSSGQLMRPSKAYYRPVESVGALIVRYRDKHGKLCTSRINFGTGFSLLEREILWQEHKKGRLCGQWAEFKHMPHGAKDEGKLRIGQLVRLRADKSGEEL